MENRLEDFLAGLQCTFGRLTQSEEELSRFLRSGKNFYLDLIGVNSSPFPYARRASPENNIHDDSDAAPLLPFWRYLIFYSTLALDQAASSSRGSLHENHEELQMYKDLATEISTCWPFLSVLISGQFHYPSTLDGDDHGSLNIAQGPLPGTISFESTSTKSVSESATASARTENSTSRRTSVDAAVQTDHIDEYEDEKHITPLFSTSEQQQSFFPFNASHEPALPPLRYSFTGPTPTPTPPFAYGRSSPEASTTMNPFASESSLPSDITTPTTMLDPAFADSLQSYSTRSTGRTLSESTQLTMSSTSTGCSDLPSTPPASAGGIQSHIFPVTPTPVKISQEHHNQHNFPSTGLPLDSPTLRQSVLMSRVSSFASAFNSKASSASTATAMPTNTNTMRSGTTTPTLPPGPSADRTAKLILADRGDNTARLVPTADGSYVLDVSIGGRKLLVHPERPAEIQYHSPQGSVVTQSLLSPTIPA